MSLMLHCGASEVKLHELKDIPITPRVYRYVGKDGTPRVLERSDKWAGIQHYDFADAVIGACYDMGMPIDHNDMNAVFGDHSFNLLLHGMQPAQSDASKAIQRLKRENIKFSYSS